MGGHTSRGKFVWIMGKIWAVSVRIEWEENFR